MSQNIQRRVTVDIGMMVTLTLSTLTGVVIWIANVKRAKDLAYLGLNVHKWEVFHTSVSLIFLLLFWFHWILNRQTFKSMRKRLSGTN